MHVYMYVSVHTSSFKNIYISLMHRISMEVDDIAIILLG